MRRKELEEKVNNLETKIAKNIKMENKMNFIDYVPIILSLLAIFISYSQSFYMKEEYKYKLPPKLIYDVVGERKIYNDLRTEYDINQFNIKILEDNNLDDIFIIDHDNNVYSVGYKESKQLGKSDQEIIKNIFDKENPSIVTGKYKYYYNFIILKSLDNRYSINIIFSKNSEKSTWSIFDPLQLYSFEKYDDNNLEFEGEKIILKKFKELIKWLDENNL